MSDLYNDMFWESLHDRYWRVYELDCEATGTRPKFKDFMVWAEDRDLVPELNYDEG